VTGVRVLRFYHSAVVDEYRERERHLRADHGYDVHLVCPPEWSEGGSIVRAPASSAFPVHVVPIYGRRHPNLFWYSPRAVKRVVQHVRPDIVDFHEEPFSVAVASALRIVKREAPDARICVYSAQNIFKRYPLPFRWWERTALATASAAYPCSSEAGKVLRAKGFRGDLNVLPLGVSVPATLPSPQSNGNFRIGFVGRLEEFKGAHVAVDAFARLSVDPSRSTLELVGGGSEEARLRAFAAELGVADRVIFAGAVDQGVALDRIAAFDVLVIPSLSWPNWKEQFGRVAVQAMIAGTPVVASTCGSLPEVVGDAGELVPEGDARALAEKLRMLASNQARVEELVRLGKQRAHERFTWARVADGVDQMYRGLLASS
jgi:glycosyltransferase involved in cell wall biosynthesis